MGNIACVCTKIDPSTDRGRREDMRDDVAVIDLVAAAARLKVPWHTAHRFVLTGLLDGKRHGGRWFVTVASVERLELLKSTEER